MEKLCSLSISCHPADCLDSTGGYYLPRVDYMHIQRQYCITSRSSEALFSSNFPVQVSQLLSSSWTFSSAIFSLCDALFFSVKLSASCFLLSQAQRISFHHLQIGVHLQPFFFLICSPHCLFLLCSSSRYFPHFIMG